MRQTVFVAKGNIKEVMEQVQDAIVDNEVARINKKLEGTKLKAIKQNVQIPWHDGTPEVYIFRSYGVEGWCLDKKLIGLEQISNY